VPPARQLLSPIQVRMRVKLGYSRGPKDSLSDKSRDPERAELLDLTVGGHLLSGYFVDNFFLETANRMGSFAILDRARPQAPIRSIHCKR
jgi:hypothetical protein